MSWPSHHLGRKRAGRFPEPPPAGLLHIEKGHLDGLIFIVATKMPRDQAGSLALQKGRVRVRVSFSLQDGPGRSLVAHTEIAKIAHGFECGDYLGGVEQAAGAFHSQVHRL